MRVVVDETKCEGHGLCESLAPDVFRLNEDGITVVLEDPVPDTLVNDVRAAVRACPVIALTIVD